MTINSLEPQELARHRQNINPPRTTLASSHGAAYKNNRERRDMLEVKALEAQVDSAAYFDRYNIDD